jgi:anti-anti-sigma regulatory factor
MTVRSSSLRIDIDELGGSLLVRPAGVLDVSTYSQMRDTLLKCVVDEPEAVIVDLGPLNIPSFSALNVFSVVALRTSDWPRVPIILVARQSSHREILRHNAVKRWVPCFESLDEAFGAVGRPPVRRRLVVPLPGQRGSSAQVRREVREACGNWGLTDADLVGDAQMIATELVENTVRHTVSAPTLRLELRYGLLTVAVADDDPREAVLREGDGDSRLSSGLLVVSKTAKAWGCTPLMSGGKVVWAVLKAGSSPPRSHHTG